MMGSELAGPTHGPTPSLGGLHSGLGPFPNEGAFKFRPRPHDV